MLLLYGLLAVFSSSAVYSFDQMGSPYSMVVKQLSAFIIGGILFYFFKALFKRSNPQGVFLLLAYLFGIASIITLLIVALRGVNYNNAGRWMRIGPMVFQPSELFKLTAIFLLIVSFNKEGSISLDKKTLLPLITIMVGLVFIIAQPDFSTMALIGFVLISILLISKFPLKKTFVIIFIVLLGFIVIIATSKYRMNRFKAHFDHAKGLEYSSKYQSIQSRKAIHDGGLFGRGLGKSKRKIFYLPQAWSDYILAIILEESGVLGLGLLLFLYIMILSRIFRIAWDTKKIKEKLFVYGVFILFLYEIILNMGVVTDLFPSTGLPLPLVSAGGSSALVFLIMLGMVSGLGERL